MPDTSRCVAVVHVPAEEARSRGYAWDRAALMASIAEVALLMSEGWTQSAACLAVGIPKRTYARWITTDSEAWQQHARGRMNQAHTLADEALDIARSRSATMVEAQDKRTHIDAIKWRCAKLHPRTYGDRAQLELTGYEGGPIEVSAQVWAVGQRRVRY